MNRRSFLQSMIAVPLVARALPHARLGQSAHPLQQYGYWHAYRPVVVRGGTASTHDFSLTAEARREWADFIARRIDDAFMEQWKASRK